MRRWGVIAAVLATAVVAASATPAYASRFMRVGIYDEAQTLYGPVQQTFTTLKQLHVQEIRLNLYWGGRFGVAYHRPVHPANPDDPAYDWSLYDRTVEYAAQYGIHVLFSVYGTPAWENHDAGANHAPLRAADLQNFALAAATRYDGSTKDANGVVIPAVKEWLAWNEPNNPVFLTPQFRRAGKRWIVQSAFDYARICNAVYAGVHAATAANERVACGGTAPRGNNDPNTARSSVSPLAFLRAVKKDGLRTFDAWDHHPYPAGQTDQPTTTPVTARGAQPTAVTFGNLSTLISTVTALYGNKRIWITEYGYQTNPPDTLLGVTYAKQAAYLTQAFEIAHKNPRIDMMLWFLLRDDPNPNGWQSGLITAHGAKKPSFNAFMRMAEGFATP